MTIELATLIALTISFISLVYLRNTDTKRRRVFNLPLWTKPKFQLVAWSVCLLPGVILLYLALYAPFIMWFAALSLLGWFVALPKPKSDV
jgi:amino acid transporter